MKIIFLDIDGVLNTNNHIKWRLSQPVKKRGTPEDWCAQACVNVNTLADKVDGRVGIVISSTWRLGASISELRQLLKRNGIQVPLIDKTPLFPTAARGEEVKAWLSSYSVAGTPPNYVIIDDDDDFLPDQLFHLIQVHDSDGFANFDKLKQAIKILSQ